MKQLNYKFLLFGLVLSMSCVPNDEIADCDENTASSVFVSQALEEYFGQYKLDNWWVYMNEDSSKVDSLFVYDYERKISIPDASFYSICEEFEDRRFFINSDYISFTDDDIEVYYNVEFVTEETYHWKVLWYSPDVNLMFQINTLEASLTDEIELVEPYLIIIDELTVNDIPYENVLYFNNGYNEFYFAPNIGLVKFKTPTDIFELHNYFVN